MSTDDKGRRISSKRDLGLEFRGKKNLVIKVMKHWDTLPRETVEFRLSVEIFKNTLGRCLNVGIVPIRKVEDRPSVLLKYRILRCSLCSMLFL